MTFPRRMCTPILQNHFHHSRSDNLYLHWNAAWNTGYWPVSTACTTSDAIRCLDRKLLDLYIAIIPGTFLGCTHPMTTARRIAYPTRSSSRDTFNRGRRRFGECCSSLFGRSRFVDIMVLFVYKIHIYFLLTRHPTYRNKILSSQMLHAECTPRIKITDSCLISRTSSLI